MGRIFIFFLLVLLGLDAYSQDYKITYSTNGFYLGTNFGIEYVRINIVSQTDSQPIDGDGDVIITGKPLKIMVRSYSLDIDEFGDVITECGPLAQEISLVFTDCFSYSNPSFSTTCLGPVYINIDISPILTFSSNTSPENNAVNSTPYCISEPIRLVASSGFSSYNWQYQVSGSSWKNFNPGTGNDVSSTLENVLGSQSASYYNKTIYFRYNVGNCNIAAVSDQRTYVFTIPPPFVKSVSKTPPTCPDYSNGSITVMTLNRPEYLGEIIIYSLNDVNNLQMDQNEIGIFTNLKGDIYNISIQGGSSYCSVSPIYKDATLIDPPQIAIVVANFSPSTCFGSNTGSATVSASGGSGSGYSYTIDGGGFTSSPSFSNLPSGSHNILVKDSMGCVNSITVPILGPTSKLSANINITSDYNGNDISCTTASDASISISANGGWGGFSYSVSEIGGYTSSAVFNNLSSGSKTFWIKDSEGCTINQTIMISSPTELVVDNLVIAQPSCPGDFGSVIVTSTGGTGTISYSIDNSNYQTTTDFYLSAGNYTLYAKDLNGCLTTSSVFSIVDPLEISYSVSKTDVTCMGASDGELLFQNIINGTPPYLYSINGGTSYSASAIFSNQSSGGYNIAAKDSKGCIVTSFISIGAPLATSGTIAVSEILCSGDSNGSLTVTATGGAGGYSYLWSNGSTNPSIYNLNSGLYSVIITDQVGCESLSIDYDLIEPSPILITSLGVTVNGYNISCSGASDGQVDLLVSGGTIAGEYQYLWSDGQTGPTLIDVSAGIYQVNITDDNGCMASETIDVTEPEPLVITSISTQDVSCFGSSDGTIQVFATGGVGTLQYSIDGSISTSSNEFTVLSVGDYLIELEDLNGCQSVMMVSLSGPTKIVILKEAVTGTLCGQSNGAINVSISGGVTPYSFEWINWNSEIEGTNEDLTNVSGGTYALTLTDSRGCSETISLSVPNSDGPTIEIDFISGPTCPNSSDGKASINVIGGTSPYEIVWSNGETGNEAISLTKGIVEVSVTDNSGCISFLSIEIPGTNPIVIDEIGINQPSCFSETDGSIIINALGGVPPLTYSWSNGQEGPGIKMLGSGEIEVIITDANGCQLIETIVVLEPDQLEVSIEITVPTCGRENGGVAALSVVGGMNPYQIFIDGVIQNTKYLDNLIAGIYLLEIIDANLCSINSEITIPDPEPWDIFYEDIIICEGQEITLRSPENASDTRWLLNIEEIGSSLDLLVSRAGTYTIIVTDSLGCVATTDFQVSTSTEVLIADFLMSSTGYVGDTIIVIDITYPIPDSLTWIAPSGFEIIEVTNDFAMFVLQVPGIYEFGFDAYLGSCQDYYSAKIEIFEKDGIPVNGRILGSTNPLIVSLEVFPNPTLGKFNVKAILNEARPSWVKLINLSNNQVVHEAYNPLSLIHKYNFELPNLSSGAYALVFETGDEMKVVRIIKR